MPAGKVSSASDILASLRAPRPIQLDSSVLKKGIDNYRVDVQLDPGLILHARQVIEDMVKRAVANKRPSSTPVEMDALNKAYEDTVRASLHRVKTDLTQAQVAILHFAILKFVLREVREQIDTVIKQMEETLAQQQFAGSRSLLVTQEHLGWLRQNYPLFVYRVGRAVIKQLQREETNQVRQLREQFLGDELPELANILFNPMLAALNPLDPHLLVENYALWPGGGKEFGAANERFEGFLASRLSEAPVAALKSDEKLLSAQTEIYDELGGLFAVQALLGPSVDQRDLVAETFGWLEHPGNLRFAFDPSAHEESLALIDGMRAQWSFKADIKKLGKLGIEARKQLAPDAVMKEMVAGYVIRDDWHPAYDDFLDIEMACAYLAGNENKKILARIDQAKEGAIGFVRKLDEWVVETNRRFKEDYDELSLRVLADLSRFRLHLRYCRFAHRMFNRLNVIMDPEQIQLSRAGNHLYQLMGAQEEATSPATEPVIVHHTILKADVRGSTTVTRELIKQDLNPASYFSTRFFGPITELLGMYGAIKVFIEGDAVILGIVEYDNAPDQWYSVARACGVAKEILDIVSSKNTHSAQSGLPTLEVGIGISYEDERPLFLFDEERPIMISPAIGSADRLSSCSRKLRTAFASHEFNVEVLKASADDQDAEKGEAYLRYNLNGILLGNEAFRKLMAEISLKKLKVKIGDAVETMFVGRFPDVRGKERDLVIREGLVGVWQDEKVLPGTEGGPTFYEVLPNSKRAGQVIEIARAQAAKTEQEF